MQGIPRGPLLLRDWSLRTVKAGEAHKLAAIEGLLATYPGLQVVLVGDSGEHDPEIYRQVVRATRAGSWPSTSATSPPSGTPTCGRSPPSWPPTGSTWSSRPTPRRPAATPWTAA